MTKANKKPMLNNCKLGILRMAMKSGSKGVHSEEKMLIYVGSILFFQS